MTVDYTSGAGPEQLKRLFAEALDESDLGNDLSSSSPLDLFLEKPGSQVGRYRLLRVLGEGGMGVVFLAQQERPIQRQAALKVIKPGMDSKRVIARFRAERQTLALLDHPNIARVLDAGATASGRPYFVMEYVNGLPITQYCDDHQFTIEERLGLFLKVCQAVQHAHQKGLIHRDLKPSNILVGMQDDLPVPKVIDFGVARAIGSSLTEHMLSTEQGQLVGTPVYMSPEQAKLIDLDVDTRTDIYSLGVLLYELLTGTPPFSEEQLREAGYLELQRIIRDQEPTRPSAKLSASGASLADSAANRQVSPETLRKSLKGDLDWIVMKCLEKDRTRRFETAHELAADLQRHLDHEPITARPPSAVYRLQKAWRRNKAVYTAVLAVAFALVAGTGISMWQASEARRNELDALRRAYNSDMSLAFRAMGENLFGRVQQSVRRHVPGPGEPDFRGWEWRYAWAQSQSDAVRVWDTPPDMDEVFTVRISPDQRFMVSSEFNPGTTSSRYVRRVWDFQTRQELKHIQLPEGRPRALAFSNSGEHLALHCGGGRDPHGIHVYRTTTWERETVIPLERRISSLSFSPDDKWLATVAGPFAVLWDWRQRDAIHQWPVEGRNVYLDVAFFPDGRWLAIGGARELKIVEVVTGEIIHREPAPDDGIPALAVSPDGRYVAIGSGYEISEIGLLDTASWKHEPPLRGHSFWVTSLTFVENGKRLVSSSADNTIRIWDMDRRVTTRVLRGHQSEVFFLSLKSDESRGVSAGKDKRSLEWDLNAPP
ncbi:MAG: protein kinase [Phycisphaerales bacterium]|nr:MAG: protein kinase [Phycisphaerales bacterium]